MGFCLRHILDLTLDLFPHPPLLISHCRVQGWAGLFRQSGGKLQAVEYLESKSKAISTFPSTATSRQLAEFAGSQAPRTLAPALAQARLHYFALAP